MSLTENLLLLSLHYCSMYLLWPPPFILRESQILYEFIHPVTRKLPINCNWWNERLKRNFQSQGYYCTPTSPFIRAHLEFSSHFDHSISKCNSSEIDSQGRNQGKFFWCVKANEWPLDIRIIDMQMSESLPIFIRLFQHPIYKQRSFLCTLEFLNQNPDDHLASSKLFVIGHFCNMLSNLC